VVGCSETSLTPLKLYTSHLLECSHPHLPRLGDMREDFSRDADVKYGYFMPTPSPDYANPLLWLGVARYLPWTYSSPSICLQ